MSETVLHIRWRAVLLALLATAFAVVVSARPALALQVEADSFSEAKAGATDVALGSRVTAPNQYRWEDWYHVRLGQAGTLHATIETTAVRYSQYSVHIYDASGTKESSQYITQYETSFDYRPVGLAKGDYYVRVDKQNGPSNYTIALSFSASSSWETESNDTAALADVLPLGKTLTGNSAGENGSDPDWYSITLPSAGTVRVTVQLEPGGGVMTARLYNADGSELIKDFGYCLSTEESLTTLRVGLPKGTYKLRLSPKNTKSESYTVRADFAAASNWETEPNESFDTADPITLGTPINLAHDAGGTSTDDDYFRLTLSRRTTVNVSLSPLSGTEAKSRSVTVYNYRQKKIETLRWGSSASGAKTLTLDAGTYYLETGCYEGEYALSVSDAAAASRAMYRLYNRWTGEHFYTASASERDQLKKVGWNDEGTGWVAPAAGDEVYRLYNPYVSGGDHHYTMDKNEYDRLAKLGWRQEGVGWYSGGSVKVYRQYNPYATTGTHNYTTSENEKNTLVRIGWKDEGTGWYAVRAK